MRACAPNDLTQKVPSWWIVHVCMQYLNRRLCVSGCIVQVRRQNQVCLRLLHYSLCFFLNLLPMMLVRPCPYILFNPKQGRTSSSPWFLGGSPCSPYTPQLLASYTWKLHPRNISQLLVPVGFAPKATHMATQALKTGGMLRCSLKEEKDDRCAYWQGRNGPQIQFLVYGQVCRYFVKACCWLETVVGIF